jgi:hypothetical protein
VQAVEMLSASPDEQCAAMGDYNVAWELKDVSPRHHAARKGGLSNDSLLITDMLLFWI